MSRKISENTSTSDTDCLKCLDVLLAFPRAKFPEHARRNPDCRGCYDILLGSVDATTGAAVRVEGVTILVVDSAPRIHPDLLEPLESSGATISHARRVDDGLNELISHQPEIALLVLPPADARSLMKRLQEVDPDVLCIIAARDAGRGELRDCQTLGAFAAFDPTESTQSLTDVLDHAMLVVTVQRDRRRLREQLILERNSSRSTLLHLPLGLMTLDADFMLVSCNPAFESTTGMSRKDVTGLPYLLERTVPDKASRTEVLRALEQSASDGKPCDALALPLVHLTNGSLRLIDWHITPLPEEPGTGAAFILVLQDVTKEKQLAHRVLQSERLAAIGEMAASVAHELKNPLAGITGALDILLAELPPQDDLLRIRDEVKNQLRRLNELAGDLLNFAKPVRVCPTNIRFRDLAQTITSALSHHPALRDVNLVEEGSEVRLSVDPVQFPMVLQNLVLNAAQSAGPGSTVNMRAEPKPGKVLITVEDDGPGFEDDVIERIFTPFFTTKSKGTGLGLPICRKIVEAHGGEIAASNRRVGGATLALTVPILDDA